jgi:hypothetical protein
MFATMLLMVCLVSVVTVMLGLFKSSTKGVDQQVALSIADRTLAQLAQADESNWAGITSNPNEIYTHDPGSQTRFETTFTVDKLNAAPATVTMGELYNVTVTVLWWDPANQTRVGYGRQSVSLTRTLYLEKSPSSP